MNNDLMLTPADVHNISFNKSPISKRGYSEDEVDAFIDLIETELARLIEDNNELRQQVKQLDADLETAYYELDNFYAGTGKPVPPSDEPNMQAAKMLSLAQEMADRLTAEAKAKLEELHTIEHEYRTRLRKIIETQLRELDINSSDMDTEQR